MPHQINIFNILKSYRTSLWLKSWKPHKNRAKKSWVRFYFFRSHDQVPITTGCKAGATEIFTRQSHRSWLKVDDSDLKQLSSQCQKLWWTIVFLLIKADQKRFFFYFCIPVGLIICIPCSWNVLLWPTDSVYSKTVNQDVVILILLSETGMILHEKVFKTRS